jgi:2-polyprenyl-6-hydroxyphenyl methylase/3-demethylubiquinone-9 3-methyltransferase
LWGGGLVSTLYSQCGFKNVYGFDASKSGIELARKSFPELAKNFFIHNAYESELPLDVPQKYDLIISMEVIEHLYDPETYLRNIYMWLKEKGHLIVTTPYHGYLKNLIITLSGKFNKHFDPLSVGGHIKFFSKQTLVTILEKTDFKVIRFVGCGRIPYIWKSMIILARK